MVRTVLGWAKRSPVIALGIVALFAASGGFALATMPLSGNDTTRIDACVTQLTGVVRIPQRRESCTRLETQISWNVVGPVGPVGPKGAQGPKGDTGAAGAPGAKGDVGAKGDKGDPGAKGDKGDPGAKGDKGDPGADGAPGAKGDPGADGAPGAKGDSGADGAPGAKGDKGEPGEDGADGQGLRWRGAYSASASYEGFDVVSHEGSSYIATTDGPTGSPAGGTGWDLVAKAGDTGARGPEGPAGPAGSGGGVPADPFPPRGEAVETNLLLTLQGGSLGSQIFAPISVDFGASSTGCPGPAACARFDEITVVKPLSEHSPRLHRALVQELSFNNLEISFKLPSQGAPELMTLRATDVRVMDIERSFEGDFPVEVIKLRAAQPQLTMGPAASGGSTPIGSVRFDGIGATPTTLAVSNVEWGVHSLASSPPSSFDDVWISIPYSAITGDLLAAALSGQSVGETIVRLTKDPHSFQYQSYELATARVTDIDLGRHDVQLALSYSELRDEYTPQKPDGSAGGRVFFCWSLAQGVTC